MKNWKELKELVKRFDEVSWKLISANGSRYNPSVEISCMFDQGNDTEFSESWYLTFHDEFFPFVTKANSMEEAVHEAYELLLNYTTQIETGSITAHYLIGKSYKNSRKIASFSVEDCRNWTRWEVDFEVYPTKELAMAVLNKEIARRE